MELRDSEPFLTKIISEYQDTNLLYDKIEFIHYGIHMIKNTDTRKKYHPCSLSCPYLCNHPCKAALGCSSTSLYSIITYEGPIDEYYGNKWSARFYSLR